MPKIKNIIFDLGGVLLDIDYYLTIHAFEELGVKDFRNRFTQYTADPFFEGLEKGMVAEELFYSKVKQAIPTPVTDEEITAAWNAMIIGFRKDSLSVLSELKENYGLYLLSNTNIIHLREINRVFKRDTGEDSLDRYFDKAWYSHLVGMRKPNREIFEFALKDAGIKAQETLFIDDTINNCETAKTLGIRTWHIAGDQNIGSIGPELV